MLVSSVVLCEVTEVYSCFISIRVIQYTKMQASRPHISREQKKFLFKYLQENPEMMSAKFLTSLEIKDVQMKWRTLANILNRLPGNRSIKSWKQWKKTWQYMKSKAKNKYIKDSGSLTEEEERIFRISGGFNENGQSSINEETLVLELLENSIDNNDYVKVNESDYKQGMPQNKKLSEKIEICVVADDSDSEEEGENHCLPPYEIAAARNVGDTHVDTTEAVHHSDEQTVMTKAFYHDRKLSCLNRIAKAKERSSRSKARIAKALEKIIASSGDSFI
nr:uncharacterized protein LOC111516956 [Leptinotarsa decemlineata]